jgi:dTDP-4-amino-4,6-dideoxygalactose transaminase
MACEMDTIMDIARRNNIIVIEERAKARLKKIEKKEKQLAEKKAREEYLSQNGATDAGGGL